MNTPEISLLQLRNQTGSGTFEAHITVEAADSPTQERFRTLCAELGVKCVLIELPEGITRLQPMTASYHRGGLDSVVDEVVDLSQRIRGAGFPVTRLKLEAVATNAGVPENEEQAKAHPAANYFEFHVKLLLPDSWKRDEAALKKLCEQHSARLSGNAFKKHTDGRSERFVTLRIYQAGRTSAFQAFDRLCDDLMAAGYTLANRLREYSIFDSHVALDAGWIDEPEHDD